MAIKFISYSYDTDASEGIQYFSVTLNDKGFESYLSSFAEGHDRGSKISPDEFAGLAVRYDSASWKKMMRIIFNMGYKLVPNEFITDYSVKGPFKLEFQRQIPNTDPMDILRDGGIPVPSNLKQDN